MQIYFQIGVIKIYAESSVKRFSCLSFDTDVTDGALLSGLYVKAVISPRTNDLNSVRKNIDYT